MLFMGSSKYPDENAYDAFMSGHGGYSNAMTECEYTIYHFEVNVLPTHPIRRRRSSFKIMQPLTHPPTQQKGPTRLLCSCPGHICSVFHRSADASGRLS